MDHRHFAIVRSVALLALSLSLDTLAENADPGASTDDAASSASPEVGNASTRAEQAIAIPLEGSAFYEKIGRRDLLETYQRRVQLKNGLKILGAYHRRWIGAQRGSVYLQQ